MGSLPSTSLGAVALALVSCVSFGCSKVDHEFNEGAGGASSSITSTTTSANGGGGGGAMSASTGGQGGSGGGGSSVMSSSTGMPPPATDLYVDPVNGDDTNDGAQASPLKTAGHAFAEIQSGHTVFLAAGNYGPSDNGDAFTTGIPDGATVIGVQGATIFEAPSSAGNHRIGLTLLGSANVSNLVLEDFSVGIQASSGTVMVSDVTIDLDPLADQSTGVAILGDAHATIDKLVVAGGATAGVDVEGSAVVELDSPDISGVGADCMGAAAIAARGTANVTVADASIHDMAGAYGVQLAEGSQATFHQGSVADFTSGTCTRTGFYLGDTSSLTLDGTYVADLGGAYSIGVQTQGTNVELVTENGAAFKDLTIGVELDAPGTADLSATSFTDCSQAAANLRGPVVTINGCQLSSTLMTSQLIYLDSGSSLTLRNSTLDGTPNLAMFIAGDYGTIDLGTATDPGDNSIIANSEFGIEMIVGGPDVSASGNTWAPNDSGSDANGHFNVGAALCGPYQSPSPGRNFDLTSTQCLDF